MAIGLLPRSWAQTTDKSLQGTVSVLFLPFMLALGNEENSHDIVSLGLP
jgi:hypothetical protein